MKLNEKSVLISATDKELYQYWEKQFSEIIPYDEYKARLIGTGVKVIEKDKPTEIKP